MYICIYMYMHVCVYIYIYVCLYIYIYVYVYIYIYIYIDTYLYLCLDNNGIKVRGASGELATYCLCSLFSLLLFLSPPSPFSSFCSLLFHLSPSSLSLRTHEHVTYAHASTHASERASERRKHVHVQVSWLSHTKVAQS